MKMKKTHLAEGLKQNDLKGMVHQLVSVDEYESKLDDDNIVVAFFLNDVDAGKDLARFLLRSEIPILDAEAVEIPTREGFFSVYIEFSRNHRFFKAFSDLLFLMKNITDIEEWTVKPYKQPAFSYDEEEIKEFVSVDDKLVKKVKKVLEPDEVKENQLRFGKQWTRPLAIADNIKDLTDFMGPEHTSMLSESFDLSTSVLDYSRYSIVEKNQKFYLLERL